VSLRFFRCLTPEASKKTAHMVVESAAQTSTSHSACGWRSSLHRGAPPTLPRKTPQAAFSTTTSATGNKSRFRGGAQKQGRPRHGLGGEPAHRSWNGPRGGPNTSDTSRSLRSPSLTRMAPRSWDITLSSSAGFGLAAGQGSALGQKGCMPAQGLLAAEAILLTELDPKAGAEAMGPKHGGNPGKPTLRSFF
jgi:hypothetical protein